MYVFFYVLGMEMDLDFRVETIPGPFKLLCSVVFCMMCEDFTFHCSHRFLHWKKIYPYIHKVHHEYVNVCSLASEHAHPLEYIVGNMLPVFMGPIILGKHCHIISFFAWGTVRLTETKDSHSGYEFSFSPFRLIPFSANSMYHEFHHSRNVGNYSTFFSIWDTVFGCNKDYYRFIK